MRGEPPLPDRESETGTRLLSPRRELIPHVSPTFFWRSDRADVRVTIARDGTILWRSKPTSGSVLAYPREAQPLEPGARYDWWLETADGARLGTPTKFRVASEDVAKETAAFERAMRDLAGSGKGTTLVGTLRCAYYRQVGAWTEALAAAGQHADADSPFADRIVIASQIHMSLAPDDMQALRTLIKRATSD